MNFAETYRKLLKQRIEADDDFLENECTKDEYSWISEIIDDIAGESKNLQLIQTYASLADKYPEETKEYNIRSFIRSSTAIVKLWLDDED